MIQLLQLRLQLRIRVSHGVLPQVRVTVKRSEGAQWRSETYPGYKYGASTASAERIDERWACVK